MAGPRACYLEDEAACATSAGSGLASRLDRGSIASRLSVVAILAIGAKGFKCRRQFFLGHQEQFHSLGCGATLFLHLDLELRTLSLQFCNLKVICPIRSCSEFNCDSSRVRRRASCSATRLISTDSEVNWAVFRGQFLNPAFSGFELGAGGCQLRGFVGREGLRL